MGLVGGGGLGKNRYVFLKKWQFCVYVWYFGRNSVAGRGGHNCPEWMTGYLLPEADSNGKHESVPEVLCAKPNPGMEYMRPSGDDDLDGVGAIVVLACFYVDNRRRVVHRGSTGHGSDKTQEQICWYTMTY